jgi:4-aminobutyrate aminotransferase/(S)-3-amino-2-methylpropionate transaminase
MVAMELVKEGESCQPDAELAGNLVNSAWRNGLILLSCGTRGNVIRFLPPLTISDELVREGIDIVESCLKGLLAPG